MSNTPSTPSTPSTLSNAATLALIARRHAVVPQGVGSFAGDMTAASARGASLIDADGREFIDFAGGIGVMNVGHCNIEVVEAVREQAERLMHACIHVATYEPYVALCEKLVRLIPHGRADQGDAGQQRRRGGRERDQDRPPGDRPARRSSASRARFTAARCWA